MTIMISREQDFEGMIHLIHTKISLQGVKPSKVALPCSKQLLKVKYKRGIEVLLQMARVERVPSPYLFILM